MYESNFSSFGQCILPREAHDWSPKLKKKLGNSDLGSQSNSTLKLFQTANMSCWVSNILIIEECPVYFQRARRSRSHSTSRFVCCMYVCVCGRPLAHEQLRSNFKVELRWLPLTELTQFFLCDSVCVSSTWVTTCHVPHVHVPFYKGTCQNLI